MNMVRFILRIQSWIILIVFEQMFLELKRCTQNFSTGALKKQYLEEQSKVTHSYKPQKVHSMPPS